MNLLTECDGKGTCRSGRTVPGTTFAPLMPCMVSPDGGPFAGKLGKVSHGAPAVSQLAPISPPALQRVVQRSLEKDPGPARLALRSESPCAMAGTAG